MNTELTPWLLVRTADGFYRLTNTPGESYAAVIPLDIDGDELGICLIYEPIEGKKAADDMKVKPAEALVRHAMAMIAGTAVKAGSYKVHFAGPKHSKYSQPTTGPICLDA